MKLNIDAVVDVNWGVAGYGAVVWWNHEGLEMVVEISLIMKLTLLKQKP